MLQETLRKILPVDFRLEHEAQKWLDQLTKPPRSLGKLEDLSCRVACIQGKVPPHYGRKLIYVFASDHGVVDEGVSAYPKEVTAQMTYNFVHGGAAINVLTRHFGVEVEVIDVGVDHPFINLPGLRCLKVKPGTANFTQGPAMTPKEALCSVETGIELANEAASKNVVLLGAGDMGIGNTSSAAAVFCAITGSPVSKIAGRGTGIDQKTWEAKVQAIEKGLAINQPDPKDALDVIAKVGGLEIGAICGLILGAAANRIPLVLDGFICTAGAVLAQVFYPNVSDYLFASHLSAETGHQAMLRELGLTPLFDLQMRLGEGTGACIAMGLIEASLKIMCEMATFESAGVAKQKR